jgi:hypothetical protein
MSEGKTVLCKVGDIAEGSMKEVAVGDQKVLVVNDKGKFYASGHKCTHYGAQLVNGVRETKNRPKTPLLFLIRILPRHMKNCSRDTMFPIVFVGCGDLSGKNFLVASEGSNFSSFAFKADWGFFRSKCRASFDCLL